MAAHKTSLDVGLIRGLMREKGMDQDAVGLRMGVHGGMVRRFLNTGEAPPDLAARMAEALGKTITEISVA